MATTLRAADRLAPLLEYPTASFTALLDECQSAASGMAPDVAAGLERFALAVRHLSRAQLQELYAETFDMNASCTLDVGWHLFGDRFERGAFLSELRPELQAAGIAEGFELPDYLPHLLILMERAAPARAAALGQLIRPAVEKLEAALHARRSPYEHLVRSAFTAAGRGE
jgi:nitrate reductase delta subunit